MSSNRIDTHHHFVPSVYATAVLKNGTKEWPSPKWSTAASEKLCSDRGIATAILSLTSPGVDIESTSSGQVSIARDANNTGASVRDSNPTKWGFFATIPNPVRFEKEALTELRRAFDDLHADGVTLMTSYAGKYLGDASFEPLWAELNRRHAVVFIHPTSAPGNNVQVNKFLLPPMLDFTFETTKTACDLILSGTIKRHPNVKIILSHGGGNLPWIWHRVAQLPKHMKMSGMSQDDFREQARSFYFDTALTGWGDNVRLLLKFAKPGHVFYGSDFPYAPDGSIKDMANGLDAVLNEDTELKHAVNWGNALKLFPRLSKHKSGYTSRENKL